MTTNHTSAPLFADGTDLARSEAMQIDFMNDLERLNVTNDLWQGPFRSNLWAGRYEIQGVLSRGGQGTTFFGKDQQTDAAVVMKVFDLQKAQDWKEVELFDREARTLQRVSHAGIPQFLERIDCDDPHLAALIMSRMPGQNLETLLAAKGSFSESALWNILNRMGHILAYLHGLSNPIVHRDLKPKNILSDDAGHLSLVDFGGVGRGRSSGASTVVGTFGFMAPEQLYGDSTPASDLYSLGATLLKLATNKEPENLPRRGLEFDVDVAASHLSPPLRKVIAQLVQPDPNERPMDGQALLKLLDDMSLQTVQKPGAHPPKGPVDAKWPEQTSDEADKLISKSTGLVQIGTGMIGLMATVVVTDVAVPILFSLVRSFATKGLSRALLGWQQKIQKAGKRLKKDFSMTIESGAQIIERYQVRSTARRLHRPKNDKK